MTEENLNIENIRKYLEKRKVIWSVHCSNRLDKRNISRADVKNAIINGKIIEYYYEDYPYPSCLILGNSSNNKMLHIVCGMNNEFLYMITAYYPDENKWDDDMKIRRKK